MEHHDTSDDCRDASLGSHDASRDCPDDLCTVGSLTIVDDKAPDEDAMSDVTGVTKKVVVYVVVSNNGWYGGGPADLKVFSTPDVATEYANSKSTKERSFAVIKSEVDGASSWLE